MHHVWRFVRRLLNVLRPHRRDDDLAREISSHLALLEDEYRRRGLSAQDAHRQARVTLGGVERIKELHRSARSFRAVDDAVRDVRYAVRLLRRAPIFAVTAIVSTGIAIGATTTIFGAINALLMRTAPGITEPDRLVDISLMSGPVGVEAINSEQYLAIRQRATRVESVFSYGLNLTPMSWDDNSGNAAEAVFTDLVTANFFTALGVRPALGRMFGEADSGRVLVLSHRFWTERQRSDPAVIGSTMRLGDRFFTIVGVAQPEFHGNTVLAPDLWIAADHSQPLDIGLVGARLKPGVSVSQARAELEAIGRDLPTGPVGRPGPATSMRLRADHSSPVPFGVRILIGGFFALLMAIVGLVLIVACANVAGLLLARAAGRVPETAVRLAMGIGQARLVRQFLTETVVLFAAGGATGLWLSRFMTAAILRLLPLMPLPANPSLRQDGRVIAFAFVLSLATAIVFGVAPALRAARVDVLALLKTHGHGGASALGLRRVFVVAQVALSALLVVVGGLLTRSLVGSASVDRGFDAHGVDFVSIDLATAGYTPATGGAFIADLEGRLRSDPAFEEAAIASATPTSGAMGFQVGVPGAAAPDGRRFFEVLGDGVTAGYLGTLRIPLLAGRDIAQTDTASAERVVIVTQAAARRFWPTVPSSQAIGRQLFLQPNLIDRGSPRRAPTPVPMTVIGIAADVRSAGTARPYIYLPIQQQYAPAVTILMRARGEQREVSRVRELLQGMNRRLPILAAGSLDDQAGPVTIQLRIAAAIAGSLGLVGVLLAGIGVYGVTSYMVARRTREIGIRVALGADRSAVVKMAMSEAARLLAGGAALGLLLAVPAVGLLRGLQFGIVTAGYIPFVGTIGLFAIVGLVASYMPVRRALAIEPSRALRYE